MQTLNYNNIKAVLRQLKESSSCYVYDIGLISFALEYAFVDFFYLFKELKYVLNSYYKRIIYLSLVQSIFSYFI